MLTYEKQVKTEAQRYDVMVVGGGSAGEGKECLSAVQDEQRQI